MIEISQIIAPYIALAIGILTTVFVGTFLILMILVVIKSLREVFEDDT